MLTLYMQECERERRIKEEMEKFSKELREEQAYKQKRRKMLRAIKVLSFLIILISYVANWR